LERRSSRDHGDDLRVANPLSRPGRRFFKRITRWIWRPPTRNSATGDNQRIGNGTGAATLGATCRFSAKTELRGRGWLWSTEWCTLRGLRTKRRSVSWLGNWLNAANLTQGAIFTTVRTGIAGELDERERRQRPSQQPLRDYRNGTYDGIDENGFGDFSFLKLSTTSGIAVATGLQPADQATGSR